jgi:stalled ribosome rescue protein Dom34
LPKHSNRRVETLGQLELGDRHLTRRGHYKQGYPIAVLVGIEERRAILWRIFSEVAKLDSIVERRGEKERERTYDFHESIVNALKPSLKEGIRSIVIAAPPRTEWTKDLLAHIRKHDAWLIQGPDAATFGELIGSAGQPHQVHELARTKSFRDVMGKTTSRDAENIAAALEKSLGSNDIGQVVSYSLEEIEDLVYGQQQHKLGAAHVVLTDRYFADTKRRGRILRLLQISKNMGIKTTVVNAETKAGLRLSQLGGLVCFGRPDRKKAR